METYQICSRSVRINLVASNHCLDPCLVVESKVISIVIIRKFTRNLFLITPSWIFMCLILIQCTVWYVFYDSYFHILHYLFLSLSLILCSFSLSHTRFASFIASLFVQTRNRFVPMQRWIELWLRCRILLLFKVLVIVPTHDGQRVLHVVNSVEKSGSRIRLLHERNYTIYTALIRD